MKLMNAQLDEGQTATAYAPVDGVEIKTLVLVDAGKLYAKRPGSDAGVVQVDPAKVFVIKS